MTTLAPITERAAAPAQPRIPSAGHGLTWGPLDPADVADLTRLVRACQEADEAPYRVAEAEIAEHFEASGLDVARDTLGGRDETGLLRAWAYVRQPPGDERMVRAFLDGGVDPAWRRRGIGAEVLAWSQDRGRQLLAASGKDLPARIGVFVDDQAAGTVAAVAAAGFAPRRYYAEMRLPLDTAPPPAPAIDGLRIEPWSEARDDAARLAHNEAFADHWGSEPQTPEQWGEDRSMFAPTWSFLAVDEATDEVVGYLLSGRYEEDWPVVGYTAGYTELLGVRRAWRGRGVARALLLAAMQAYRADGMEYAEIGVDTENPSGAHGLYARLGYVVFHGSALHSIEL